MRKAAMSGGLADGRQSGGGHRRRQPDHTAAPCVLIPDDAYGVHQQEALSGLPGARTRANAVLLQPLQALAGCKRREGCRGLLA